MARVTDNRGFTLIEIAIVIVTLAILATAAMLRMQETIETAKYEGTKAELDNLARAIVGNPDVYTAGARSDFGYVGDNGTLPATLDALAQNPGGWSTWQGPYIEAGNNDEFKKDAWGVNYTYNGTSIVSTGSGSNITRTVAASATALTANIVSGSVRDANLNVPTGSLGSSIAILLSYPNGSGGTTTASTSVDDNGVFTISSVPIGNHALRVIYTPDTDTLAVPINVCPGRDVHLDIIFPADLW